MRGGAVSESAPIYYEEMSKVAGTENDKQSITLIATDDAYNFGDYITLRKVPVERLYGEAQEP